MTFWAPALACSGLALYTPTAAADVLERVSGGVDPSPRQDSSMDSKVVVPGRGNVQAVTLEDCLKNGTCSGLFWMAVGEVVGAHLREVEGAAPGRFFPETVTFVLRRMDEEGNFLTVLCILKDRRQVPCPDKRDKLQKRFLDASALQAIPAGEPKERLFNQMTWKKTARGAELLAKLQRHYPDFWARMARIVTTSVGAPRK